MPKKGEPRLDTSWRKSRIAARILLREAAANPREFWKILRHKEIDVRGAIIWPALERSQHDYLPADPTLKTRLANLKLPDRK